MNTYTELAEARRKVIDHFAAVFGNNAKKVVDDLEEFIDLCVEAERKDR